MQIREIRLPISEIIFMGFSFLKLSFTKTKKIENASGDNTAIFRR